MNIVQTDDWTLDARCRGMADALFPEGKDQKRARIVCMGCPVRAICLAEALDNSIEWGVWGGLTERERRQLLRQRPEVTSWLAVLTSSGDVGTHGHAAGHEPLPAGVVEVMRGLPTDHPHVRAAMASHGEVESSGAGPHGFDGAGAGRHPVSSRG